MRLRWLVALALLALPARAQTVVPLTLAAPQVTAHSATLTWNAPVGGDAPTGYRVYRRSGPASYGTGTPVPLTPRNYVDLNVTQGTTYFYVVTAYNAGGESVFSNEVTGTIPADIPPATNVTSLWPNTTVPASVTGNDSASVELGVKFSSSVPGVIVGIKFYKATNSTGTHTAHLWNAAGTSLGTGTFTGETASGWQTFTFPSPIPILGNTTYTASIHTIQYAWSLNYFNAARVVAPLTAPVNAGVYRYGTTSAVPISTWQGSNYWVDVLFQPAGPPAVTISIAPASATMTAGSTQQFTATVSNTTNTAAAWTATGGSVSTNGLYTAGLIAGTFNVTTTSVADSTKTATASVIILPPPPTLTVDCNAAKAAFTASNIPAGTTLTITGNAGGAPPATCSSPLP